jgi:outer membrane protein assembly factor BamB
MAPGPRFPVAVRIFASVAVCMVLLLGACSQQAGRAAAPGTRRPPMLFLIGYETLNHDALYAVNAADGSIRWSTPQISDVWVPQVSGDIVYAYTGVSAQNRTGTLFALDALTGAVRWSTTDGYVGSGPNATYLQGPDMLFAVDPKTGKELWHAALSGTVMMSGGALYTIPFTTTNQRIDAFDPATGATRWHSDPVLRNVGLIFATLDGVVLAGGGLTLYALDAQTGALRWQRTSTQETHFVKTALPCGASSICLGYSDGTVEAVDATDGTPRWRYVFDLPPVPQGDQYNPVAFAVDGGLLLVKASERLAVIATADGTQRWQKDLSFESQTLSVASRYPLYASGVIYIVPLGAGPGTTAQLLALNAADGSLKWSGPADASEFGALLVGDRLCLDGHSAYDAATGRLLWQSHHFMRVTFVVAG